MARVVLVMLLLGCGPDRHPAPPAPRAAPDAAALDREPPVDAAVSWCIDDTSCQPGLDPCLGRCYKYNHPNGPANDHCDRNCREDYCARIICPPR